MTSLFLKEASEKLKPVPLEDLKCVSGGHEDVAISTVIDQEKGTITVTLDER